MKLLTIAVPCYNSAAYMENCIKSLLVGGDEVEILIVNDGSKKDNTAEIADRLEAEHPGIIRAIHQENKGHGGAVNTGIREASGRYFKVVDSDDWVDAKAYQKILDALRSFEEKQEEVDMVISNYIYDKDGAKKKKVMKYSHAFPKEEVFGWDRAKRLHIGQYILMHSVIYRTELLRECGLELPEHTFYVDNIYVYHPIPSVKKLYYIDVNFYHYYIGREDQSVNEQIMISRIDQQLRVNRIMFDMHDLPAIEDKHIRNYMYQYLKIICTISSILLVRSGTPEHLAVKKDLWDYFKQGNKKMYHRLRYSVFGIGLHLPGKLGRKIMVTVYTIAQKRFGFN